MAQELQPYLNRLARADLNEARHEFEELSRKLVAKGKLSDFLPKKGL